MGRGQLDGMAVDNDGDVGDFHARLNLYVTG